MFRRLPRCKRVASPPQWLFGLSNCRGASRLLCESIPQVHPPILWGYLREQAHPCVETTYPPRGGRYRSRSYQATTPSGQPAGRHSPTKPGGTRCTGVIPTGTATPPIQARMVYTTLRSSGGNLEERGELWGHVASIASGSPFRPSQHTISASRPGAPSGRQASVAYLGQYRQPVLGAFAAFAEPYPQHVFTARPRRLQPPRTLGG